MGGDGRLFLSAKGVEVTLSPAFAMDDRLRSSLSSSGFKNSDIELGVGVAELEARPFTDLDAGLGGQAGSGACVRDSAMRRLLVRGQLGCLLLVTPPQLLKSYGWRGPDIPTVTVVSRLVTGSEFACEKRKCVRR